MEATTRAHGALEDWLAERLRRQEDIETRWAMAGDPVSDRLVEVEAVDVEQAWDLAEAWWTAVAS